MKITLAIAIAALALQASARVSDLTEHGFTYKGALGWARTIEAQKEQKVQPVADEICGAFGKRGVIVHVRRGISLLIDPVYYTVVCVEEGHES